MKEFLIKSFYSVLIIIILSSLSLSLFACKWTAYDFTGKTFILHASGEITVDGKKYSYTNTIDNFVECYNAGFRYFEVDLMLSTDHKLIGTHNYEYLTEFSESGIDYYTYCDYKILGNLNGITIARLVDVLKDRTDAYVVLDTKEKDPIGVIDELIIELTDLGYSNLITNFIPQLYSYEMWTTMKDDYPFDKYLYTNYVSNYSINDIISYFANEEKIFAITLWLSYKSTDIMKLRTYDFEVYLHTINEPSQIAKIFNAGATGVYTDNTKIYEY